MIVKNGALYLTKEEMAKCLSIFCTPDLHSPRCKYNSNGADFKKCVIYEFVSMFSPELKRRVSDERQQDASCSVICPILHDELVYGTSAENNLKSMLKDTEYKIESAS